jgi:hypothetical protein
MGIIGVKIVKPSAGMSHKYARQLYSAVAVPKILYTVDVGCSLIRKTPTAKRAQGSIGFTSKLSHIQRVSTIQATGTLHTTATGTLNVYVDLLLMLLLVNRICHTSILRLTSLPRSHPLRGEVQQAVKGVKIHWMPLHNLFSTFPIKPTKIEVMQEVHCH